MFLEDLLTIFASRKMQKSQLENRIPKSQDCLKIDYNTISLMSNLNYEGVLSIWRNQFLKTIVVDSVTSLSSKETFPRVEFLIVV